MLVHPVSFRLQDFLDAFTLSVNELEQNCPVHIYVSAERVLTIMGSTCGQDAALLIPRDLIPMSAKLVGLFIANC